MRGPIVIDTAAGRALRKQHAAVRANEVLYCAGDFRAGDRVYVAFRAVDGGQYVVATGIIAFDEATLQQMIGPPTAAAVRDQHAQPDASLVIRAEDVELLWPVESAPPAAL